MAQRKTKSMCGGYVARHECPGASHLGRVNNTKGGEKGNENNRQWPKVEAHANGSTTDDGESL